MRSFMRPFCTWKSSFVVLAVGVLMGGLTACSSLTPGQTGDVKSSRIAPEAVTALAPSGTLRASINLGNPVLATRHAKTGELQGVSVDLARELGRQLGVPVELLAVDSAGRSVERVTGGEADVGFFAIDPVRGKGIAFTRAYVVIEGAYMVRNESPLKDNAQVDKAGTRIVVGKGSAYDLFLTREIKQATLVRAPTSPKVVDEFIAQQMEVAAGVRQQLEADAQRVPGVRVLPGRFMVIEQAMGVASGRSEIARETLRSFVERMKASGFVGDALKRHGIDGAAVAD